MKRYSNTCCSPRCSASSCFGHGIKGHQAQPFKIYKSKSGKDIYAHGAIYGKEYPTSEECSKAIQEAGYSQVYLFHRESNFSYKGELRRSMRKAMAKGLVTSQGIYQWFQAFLKQDFFLKEKEVKDFLKKIELNKLYYTNTLVPKQLGRSSS